MSYYIAPSFLNKLSLHITKNFLDIPGVRVPLILGIHGRKGEGKSFQCDLVFERMGIEVTLISGGELESPDAGDPARLIRLRYRETAELIKVRGKMCVLMINDLDAGAGRFDEGTQYTVNTQLVNATLMNIADNPTNVQLPGSYDDNPLHRVPIIVTGNDFSTLYAPLIRDGRMEKFYWEPDRDDKVGIVGGIFSDDGLSERELTQFVDTFIHQSIDFFSAVRSRVYDEQILRFIHDVGIEHVSQRVVNSLEGAPKFPKPNFNLARLIEIGNQMVGEQQRVQNSRLVEEYNRGALRHHANFIPQTVAETPNGSNYVVTPVTPVNTVTPVTTVTTETPVTTTYVYQKAPETPATTTYEYQTAPVTSTYLSLEIQEKIRNILSRGYKIGLEHVDERRFRTGSWTSCPIGEINGEWDAISNLQSRLAECRGEYVRLVGIDPKDKRRVIEAIIQRPNGNGDGNS
jgi:ribulose bisphosphate carboxylase small subunit